MEQGNVEQSSPVNNPQVSRSQQVTPPPAIGQSSSKKLLLIGGIILGFVLFGIGGYVIGMQRSNQSSTTTDSIPTVTQSPTNLVQSTPTSQPAVSPTGLPIFKNGWSTYNNSKNYYTISYPSNWQVDDYKGVFVNIPGEVTFTPPSELSIQPENYRTKVAIMMMTTEKVRYNLNTQEQFDEWLSMPTSSGEGERRFKVANATVGGSQGVRFVTRTLPGDGTEPFYSVVVWLRRNGANYYFELGGEESKVLQNVSLFDKMLQSVKFSN